MTPTPHPRPRRRDRIERTRREGTLPPRERPRDESARRRPGDTRPKRRPTRGKRRTNVGLHRLLLLLAVLGAVFGVFSMLDIGWADDNAEKAPVATADPHASDKPCSSCHEPPTDKHFSVDCASCHSPTRPFARPQLAHVTFGAHTQATQACATCHAPKPGTDIACRSCHGTKCGKNAKSASDCLKCHKSGTTDRWVPESGVPKAE